MSPEVGDDARRERPEPQRPQMTPETARIEGAIEQAIARGDFEDLPGAGKPLNLPRRHDPDWWIKQRLEEDDVDRDALLPPVVLLRREYDRREETLAELRDEQAVREYAHDYTERVLADRGAHPMARMLAPELDPEDAVAHWRELRTPQVQEREDPGPPSSADTSTSTSTDISDGTSADTGTARRRWWPFGGRR